MIISVGEALVDILPDGTVAAGGGPMNAAITAARQGAPTAFVGRVSTDEFGHQIWTHLTDSGVDLGAAQRGDEPTARAIVETHPVQRFTFEGDGTADASMTGLNLGPLGEGPHILHGGTLGIFRGTTAEVLSDLAAGFKARYPGSLISFDPNVRPAIIEQVGRDVWWRYADVWIDNADLVRGSDEDFEWMGVTAEDLLKRGVKAVVETLGPDGAVVKVAGRNGNGVEEITLPAPVADVVDTVGAGDSFCGAMLVMLGRHGWPAITKEWRSLLGFALAVAAKTVAVQGADPPWADER